MSFKFKFLMLYYIRLAPKFLDFCKYDLEKFHQIYDNYEHLVEITRFLDTNNLVIKIK